MQKFGKSVKIQKISENRKNWWNSKNMHNYGKFVKFRKIDENSKNQQKFEQSLEIVEKLAKIREIHKNQLN